MPRMSHELCQIWNENWLLPPPLPSKALQVAETLHGNKTEMLKSARVFPSILLFSLATFGCSNSGESEQSSVRSTPLTYVQPAPPSTNSTLSADGQMIMDWLDANQSTTDAMRSAVGLFEAEIMSGANRLDNRGIARAAIVLYQALSNVPLQPPNIPLSREYNVAINQMTVVMTDVSAYALAGKDYEMLMAAMEWEAARDYYDAWFTSLPRD